MEITPFSYCSGAQQCAILFSLEIACPLFQGTARLQAPGYNLAHDKCAGVPVTCEIAAGPFKTPPRSSPLHSVPIFEIVFCCWRLLLSRCLPWLGLLIHPRFPQVDISRSHRLTGSKLLCGTFMNPAPIPTAGFQPFYAVHSFLKRSRDHGGKGRIILCRPRFLPQKARTPGPFQGQG